MKHVLQKTEHRPYPLPDSPWIMKQVWYNLLFMHWKVPISVIRSKVPPMLEIDTFENETYIAITPLGMKHIHLRFLPEIPFTSNFLELNVRVYVRHKGKPGVFFFSLDAESPISVEISRAWFHLPYLNAKIQMSSSNDSFLYKSMRDDKRGNDACLEVKYNPTSKVYFSKPGSLENWLTERYCLYSVDSKGNLYIGEIHHELWPLQKVQAEVIINTMANSHGIQLPFEEPILHFVKEIEVAIYPLRKL